MTEIIIADGFTEYNFIKNISQRSGEVEKSAVDTVKKIIEDVRKSGDDGVIKYSKKFDGVNEIKEVSHEKMKEAYENMQPQVRVALQNAANNIKDFHLRQKREGFTVTDKKGIILGYRILPLERVGLYVPGGTAAYPSSVLMNAIPAKIAGVSEIIMITPPSKDGGANLDILAAAYMCGVDRVFLIGGAQGVAALALGTKTIPKVDKIVGPGNIFVATAKRLLFGEVDIDMIAGPSEILIIAEKGAEASYIAADMMSQAEHDKLSSSILITDSEELAKQVIFELERQVKYLSRKEIIEHSLKNYGAIIVVDDIIKAAELSNLIAPEHLELLTAKPLEYLEYIKNAGSVFLGEYSPEPLGDYYAGPNHVLPTSGTARFFSSLCVDSFIKKSGFTYYTKSALNEASNDIVTLCNSEGLDAHANSIKVRFLK